MIDVLKQQFTPEMPQEEKLNRTRELLQIMALKALYDHNAFENIAFVGGTALRILYNLRRFSEDLDFSLTNAKGYDFKELNAHLVRYFKLNGLEMESKPKVENTVHSAFLKFGGLMKELGLSGHKEQALSIKLEVDTNPPQGGETTSTLINKTYLFNVRHFDLPSMYATKLHACFYRRYTKGRDFYDFIWYLGRRTEPNFVLLNNAIKQTEGKNPALSEKNFKDFLLSGLGKVDLRAARTDVERFLEDKSELKLFDQKSMESAINSAYNA